MEEVKVPPAGRIRDQGRKDESTHNNKDVTCVFSFLHHHRFQGHPRRSDSVSRRGKRTQGALWRTICVV